jgi:hypothetical protein
MAPDAGARFSSAWRAHTDRIFREARRAGRREPPAAYAADALVALASEGPCKPVEVQLVANSAPIVRGHAEPGERCEIRGIGPVPVTQRGRCSATPRCVRSEIRNTWRISPHHHALKTHFGWKVVGEPGNWDLAPPDDPDPP